MKPLIDRIAEARDIAVGREGDIRIQEFLRAMVIGTDPRTGAFWSASICCDPRAWFVYFQPPYVETLEALSTEDLAQTVAEWVQGAIDGKFLSLSNPPVVYRKHQPQSRRQVSHTKPQSYKKDTDS